MINERRKNHKKIYIEYFKNLQININSQNHFNIFTQWWFLTTNTQSRTNAHTNFPQFETISVSCTVRIYMKLSPAMMHVSSGLPSPSSSSSWQARIVIIVVIVWRTYHFRDVIGFVLRTSSFARPPPLKRHKSLSLWDVWRIWNGQLKFYAVLVCSESAFIIRGCYKLRLWY